MRSSSVESSLLRQHRGGSPGCSRSGIPRSSWARNQVLRARLHVEEEEQAVEVAEAFPGELARPSPCRICLLLGLRGDTRRPRCPTVRRLRGRCISGPRETAKACLWEFSSERSSRQAPSAGMTLSWCSSAADGSPWAVVPARRGSRRCRSAACASAPTCCGPGAALGRC